MNNATETVELGQHTSLPKDFVKTVSGGGDFKLSSELDDMPMQPIKAVIRVKRNKEEGGKGPWAGVYITFTESKVSTVITANVSAIRAGILIPSPNNPDAMVVGPETMGWNKAERRPILS